MTRLWLRGALFTIAVPGAVAVAAPALIDPDKTLAGGAWRLGWLVAVAGAAIYAACLRRFLAAGGTPAIYFSAPLGAVIGEEPGTVVVSGLYARSRNPMYLGVLLVVAGQAIVFASATLAWYAALLALAFHGVVVWLEEPHLRQVRGEEYIRYAARVPRWLGRARVAR